MPDVECSRPQLKKKADLQHAQRLAWEDRERQAQMRVKLKERERMSQIAEKADRQAQVERMRRQAQLIMQEKLEDNRQKLQRKLVEAELRAEAKHREKMEMQEAERLRAAQVDLRRGEIREMSAANAEYRRQVLVAKQMAMEDALMRKSEERKAEEAARRQQEALREKRREEARRRADEEQHSRTVNFYMKQQRKEEALARRRQEQEEAVRAKSTASMRRHEFIGSKVQEQAARDEEDRDRRLTKILDKMDRADRLQMQRDHVLQALQEARREMRMQEEQVRQKLERMERTGRLDELDELDVLGLSSHGVSAFLDSLKTQRPRSAPARGRPAPKPHRAQSSSRFWDPSSWGQETLAGETMFPPASAGLSELELYDTVADGLGETAKSEGECMATGTPDWEEQKVKEALDGEVAKEMERQSLLTQVSDPQELERLQMLFALERKIAIEKIEEMRAGGVSEDAGADSPGRPSYSATWA
ncbi:unnamed protein product [Ostreobium quekettii]|uniref:Uncharacterized protein n=1 Tax=Ostreobium quekettii TaxID=121088 RepID=A0A8S1IRC0_9CHLO|nr:unnamed protein product [Ostreobium quekettii]